MKNGFMRHIYLTPLVALVVSALTLAAVHLSDHFAMDPASGVWLGLASYVNHGVFYPPLQDDGYYAGTRYMPLFFCLHAVFARLTSDYLVAGKLLSLLAVALLFCAVAIAVHRRTGNAVVALVLASLLLASRSGLLATWSIRCDALPAALSIFGLVVLERAMTRNCSSLPAASLFTLALLAKFTAVAGLAAALATPWGWRRQLRFAVQVGAMTVAALTASHFLSHGWFFRNLLATGSPELKGEGFLSLLSGALIPFVHDPVSLPLLILGTVIVVREVARCRIGPWDLYFIFCAAVTMVIFVVPGTTFNHLIELESVSLLLVSTSLAKPDDRSGRAARYLRLATISTVVFAAYVGALAQGFAWASSIDRSAYRLDGLAAAISPHAKLLSEDCAAPVALGQRPVVLDPFSFRVLAQKGLIDDGALAARVRRQEFDAITLWGRIDLPGQSFCPVLHFGERVTDAIRDCYHFESRTSGYDVFLPNVTPQPKEFAHRTARHEPAD
jgi:hypothetical protein